MAEGKSVNIASHLPEMARKLPDSPAVIVQDGFRYEQCSFRKLDMMSDAIAHSLERIGIKRGTRAVLMVKPSVDFFAITFALFKIGAVPVMIDPGIGIKNLRKCIDAAKPKAFIGIPKAHIARIIFGWGRISIKVLVTAGKRFGWGGPTVKGLLSSKKHKRYNIANTQPDETAAILFTSGNTGISKGVVYPHRIFDSQVKYQQTVYKIKPGEKDLATFPLFALFGPALGMTAIIPDMDAARPVQADPRKIIHAIKKFNATNMFASPALINKISRHGVRKKIKLPSLKRVISAGAPASTQSLRLFSSMLAPGVQVFTPYGATEALPVCNIGSDEIISRTNILTEKGKGNCIGRPVPGMDLKIIRITDTPIKSWSNSLVLPEGEIGEIAVKGPVVTREYYRRPKQTALAKIPEKNKGFYHRMGDVGYKDKDGKVWFCGRKSHRVTTTEETLFTLPCEAIYNTHPDVFRTALVGVKNSSKVVPVLCVELEKNVPGNKESRIRKELLSLGRSYPHTANINKVMFHPAFPVDIRHNAKIFRERLAVWAGRELP
ncbi:AMP-binding protein [Candidatus Woesearchaeota archaeon]|nr:AMP-binding protein [Candidatus Woesearchaeota archaeon]